MPEKEKKLIGFVLEKKGEDNMVKLFWKTKNIELSVGKKKICFEVKVVPFWYEGFGLMFKNKKNAKPLLFDYAFSTRMSIFSFFIPFNFLAVWINKDNKIIELKIVKPNTPKVKPNKKFKKLIEIPMTKNYQNVTSFIFNNSDKMLKIKIL